MLTIARAGGWGGGKNPVKMEFNWPSSWGMGSDTAAANRENGMASEAQCGPLTSLQAYLLPVPDRGPEGAGCPMKL